MSDHPKTGNLKEGDVLGPLDSWIGHLFSCENGDQTVAALLASQTETAAGSNDRGAMKKRLADAEARLRRYQAAIAAGVDPAALVEAINEAQAQRAAAQAELEGAPPPNHLTDAEVYAMIDSLGDVGAALTGARPENLSRLYQELGLELRYEPHERAVIATATPRVVSARVRGGTPTRGRGTPAQSRCACENLSRLGVLAG